MPFTAAPPSSPVSTTKVGSLSLLPIMEDMTVYNVARGALSSSSVPHKLVIMHYSYGLNFIEVICEGLGKVTFIRSGEVQDHRKLSNSLMICTTWGVMTTL